MQRSLTASTNTQTGPFNLLQRESHGQLMIHNQRFFFDYSHPFSLITLSFWQASPPCSFYDAFCPDFFIIPARGGRGHPRAHSWISLSAACLSPAERSQAEPAAAQLARVIIPPCTGPVKHCCPPPDLRRRLKPFHGPCLCWLCAQG